MDMNVNFGKLYLDDVYKLFLNYTPSRLKIFEIVRHLHKYHTSALLYLLDNTKRKKNAKIYEPLNNDLIYKIEEKEEIVYKFCKYVTLNLDRCDSIHQILPLLIDYEKPIPNIDILKFLENFGSNYKDETDDDEDDDDDDDDNNTNDINNNDIKFLEKSNNIKIFKNNLSSEFYLIFLSNVKYFLLPDSMQLDRNETNITFSINIVKQFLLYYDSISYKNIQLENLDAKTFTRIIRPRNIRIYNYSEYDDNVNYIKQPLYHGFHVVINTINNVTRTYNRYGELKNNFTHMIQLKNLNATFEAVILFKNDLKELKSWRFIKNKIIQKNHLILVVVDVFRINHTMFTCLPFEERYKQINLITNDCIYSENDILTNYNKDSIDPVISGNVYRKKNSLCSESAFEYRQPLNKVYVFMNDCLETINEAHKSSLIYVDTYPNLEMSKYRTVCVVYSDDSKFFYVAQYNPTIFQYIHVGKIEKLQIDTNQIFKYNNVYIFIVNNKIPIKGLLLLRVYYNDAKDLNSIVGYELKSTTSIYDVPAFNTKDNLFNL